MSDCSGCKFGNAFGGCEIEGPCIMVSATAPPAKKSITDYAPAPKEFDQAQVAFYARIRALATRVSDKRVKEARKSAARAAQRHRDVELRVAKKFRADA